MPSGELQQPSEAARSAPDTVAASATLSSAAATSAPLPPAATAAPQPAATVASPAHSKAILFLNPFAAAKKMFEFFCEISYSGSYKQKNELY